MAREDHVPRKTALCFILTGLALLAAASAAAQDFPNRPITIMVGLAPGGITDITTRLYAEVVARSIGQRIVVENRTGAGDRHDERACLRRAEGHSGRA